MCVAKETTGNQQQCWRLCGDMNVAHMHIFWSCQGIIGYWDKIWWGLRKIIGYEIPKSCMILYLGNLTQDTIRKEDEYLVEVLLLASKKAITRLWYKTEPPTVEQWVSTVEEMYVIEKITHKPQLQETQFQEKMVKMHRL